MMAAVVFESAPLTVALLVFVLSWRVAETVHYRSERPEPADDVSHDLGSARLLALSSLVSVPAGLTLSALELGPEFPGSDVIWFSSGVVMMILGLALRAKAAVTLGPFFRRRITMQDNHTVIADGPYKFVRHPAYSGLTVAVAGLGVSLGYWVALAVTLIPVAAAVVRRVLLEERALRLTLGAEYDMYADARSRLFPGLW